MVVWQEKRFAALVERTSTSGDAGVTVIVSSTAPTFNDASNAATKPASTARYNAARTRACQVSRTRPIVRPCLRERLDDQNPEFI
jgi:hypothetical protein